MFSLSLPGNIEDIWLVCLVSEFGEFCAGSSALTSAPVKGPATDQLHAMGSSASGGGRSVAAGAGGSVVSANGFAAEMRFDSDEPKEQ